MVTVLTTLISMNAEPVEGSMTKTVVICGDLFDGRSDALLGPTEILIEGDTIADLSGSVARPTGAKICDLSDRTVSPGFIDTHVHLCVDGLNLARQTLQCSSLRRSRGFTTPSSTCVAASRHFGTWAHWIQNGPQSSCATRLTEVWFTDRV
jgi:imidazolonepropionase-like amidohydrolase